MLGGGGQTKSILRMYHCRPHTYYILYIEMRDTTPEGGVNSTWLGGVEFFSTPPYGWLDKPPIAYTGCLSMSWKSRSVGMFPIVSKLTAAAGSYTYSLVKRRRSDC